MPPRATRRGAVVASAVLVLGLLLAACGSTGPGSGDGASAGSGSGGRDTVPASQVAFTGTTLSGDAFDSTTRPGRPQVLWFWAPWCAVCRAESPDVAKVADYYATSVDFVGIAGRGQVAEMQAFVTETGTGGFEHVSDETGALWKQFGVAAQPSFVFVAADGTATRVVGSLDATQLDRRVKSLVAS